MVEPTHPFETLAYDRGRFAVVDVETTGFDPRSDRVVEMACVTVEDGLVVETWSTLVDPEMSIPERATHVHGIRDRDVVGAPNFAFAQWRLAERCWGTTVAAHNAAFDLGFLPRLRVHPVVCTLALARFAFPDAPNFKNQTLRTYLGIEVAREGGLVAHRALDDALVTAHVLVRCFERLRARDALIDAQDDADSQRRRTGRPSDIERAGRVEAAKAQDLANRSRIARDEFGMAIRA